MRRVIYMIILSLMVSIATAQISVLESNQTVNNIGQQGYNVQPIYQSVNGVYQRRSPNAMYSGSAVSVGLSSRSIVNSYSPLNTALSRQNHNLYQVGTSMQRYGLRPATPITQHPITADNHVSGMSGRDIKQSKYSSTLADVGLSLPPTIAVMGILGEGNIEGNENSTDPPPNDDDGYDPNDPKFGDIGDGLWIMLILAMLLFSIKYVRIILPIKKNTVSLHNK